MRMLCYIYYSYSFVNCMFSNVRNFLHMSVACTFNYIELVSDSSKFYYN